MGDGLKQPLTQAVEGAVEAADDGLEGGDLGRPDVGRAADVPEFLQVGVGRALGGLDPERRVAALAGAAGDPIAPLDRIREREEGLGAVLRGRDQAGVEPMVGDDGEAIALERGAERIGESIEILPMKAKRDGLNGKRNRSFSRSCAIRRQKRPP